MKLTDKKYQTVKNIIDEHRLIKDRVEALRKKKFIVKECPIKMGRACVGIVHHYANSARIQIGSPKGYLRYAWVVMFDPMPADKIWELNRKRFGKLL